MAKKPGLLYELITKKIFDEILNRNDINTTKVKHDITLQGIKTSHQIDVYWEFENAGISYTTIVQVKDWNKAVDQGELLKFSGVLDDLPNQPRGVFVTRSGYQKGALDIAKASGILLYELREVTKADSGPSLVGGFMEIRGSNRNTTDIRLVHDEEWMQNELAKPEHKGLRFEPKSFKEQLKNIILYDQSGKEITTLQELTDSYYPDGTSDVPLRKIIHTFCEPTFFKTSIERFPIYKLKAVTFTISAEAWIEREPLIPANLVGFILRNVIEGTDQTFDNQCKPK